jgi:hypothetical protein
MRMLGRIRCREINKITDWYKCLERHVVEMDDEELYVPAEAASAVVVIKCCLKNQNYVISMNWKNLRVNENQWVKDSERKTMSESEVNERGTFTHR